MPQLRDPILVPFERSVVDETAIDFITETWSKRGEVWFIEQVGARNANKHETVVAIGLRRGSANFWFRSLVLTTRGQWYNFPFRITTLTDYQVILRFTNIDPGDHLYANVNAYILEPFEQPGVEAYRGG